MYGLISILAIFGDPGADICSCGSEEKSKWVEKMLALCTVLLTLLEEPYF